MARSLALAARLAYFPGEMTDPAIDPDYIPAPPELVEKAEAAVREFSVTCFWFWGPHARVRFLGDVRLVIHHLREYGGWKAWWTAQELQRCL